MTCLEVRAKLAEYALAQLARVEANEVDRHLAWCTGCRKEAGELLEGATAVAYTLVPAEPRMGLEDRVVDRITTAAGTGRRHRRGSNRTVRVLASVTVAAVLAATGAVGWAVAERRHAQTVTETARNESSTIKQFQQLVNAFKGGTQGTARLLPLGGATANQAWSGDAIVFSSPQTSDFFLVEAVLPRLETGSYLARLTDRRGNVISGGPLSLTDKGEYLFVDRSGSNLSNGTVAAVLNPKGKAVLVGTVEHSSAT